MAAAETRRLFVRLEGESESVLIPFASSLSELKTLARAALELAPDQELTCYVVSAKRTHVSRISELSLSALRDEDEVEVQFAPARPVFHPNSPATVRFVSFLFLDRLPLVSPNERL